MSTEERFRDPDALVLAVTELRATLREVAALMHDIDQRLRREMPAIRIAEQLDAIRREAATWEEP